MGAGDRDYMRASSRDEEKIESYENTVRAREYGDLESRRRHTIQKIVFLIIAILALLAVFGVIAPLVR